ncbi:ribosomal protein S18-alanine N-acetyltransferase [Glaciecola siphonariae]|uniref:Ribosomal protein S18-alanine N-acetyltransferase n=1 Tax=Glaciecola siphonariae TaxID=521012 RepID=A0ABV9LTJ9_9ALTE
MATHTSRRTSISHYLTMFVNNDVHIEQAYQLFSQFRSKPWSLELFQQALQQPFSMLQVSEGEVSAVLLVSNVLDEAEIEDICVNPKHQRQGLARYLLSECLTILRTKGYKKIHLEVRQSNVAAIRLYESMGFALQGTRKHYYDTDDGQKESALLYRLDIRMAHT